MLTSAGSSQAHHMAEFNGWCRCGACVNLPDKPTHLQNEDEIIHRLVPVEEVVTARVPVLLVVYQLLDDIGMLQQAQQNLF